MQREKPQETHRPQHDVRAHTRSPRSPFYHDAQYPEGWAPCRASSARIRSQLSSSSLRTDPSAPAKARLRQGRCAIAQPMRLPSICPVARPMRHPRILLVPGRRSPHHTAATGAHPTSLPGNTAKTARGRQTSSSCLLPTAPLLSAGAERCGWRRHLPNPIVFQSASIINAPEPFLAAGNRVVVPAHTAKCQNAMYSGRREGGKIKFDE